MRCTFWPLAVRGFEAVSYLELMATPKAAHWAREHTRIALQAWQLAQETIETAELLISELATNAVQHANMPRSPLTCTERAEGRTVSLALLYHADSLIIEVYDTNPAPPVLTDTDLEAESGRGLMLVQALSKEWNYYLPPSGGKTVYCVINADKDAYDGQY